MPSRRERLLELLEAWQGLHTCSPSADPDEQTAVFASHQHLLLQIQRLAAPLLSPSSAADLKAIELEVDSMYAVYNARAQLAALLPEIEEALEGIDDDSAWPENVGWIVDPRLVPQLRQGTSEGLSLSLLAHLCEEINSSFAAGNMIATVLLMRAVLNYVPPLFGQESFAQVAAQSGRSLRTSFETLETGLRKIADFHTHRRIGKADLYPSAAQVEPFKPQFELLLQEVLRVASPG